MKIYRKVDFPMSRRKRIIEKQKKEAKKQKARAARQRAQGHSYVTWEEKKRRKRQSQEAYKEGKFPNIHEECELEPFQLPSPRYCSSCVLDCQYRE